MSSPATTPTPKAAAPAKAAPAAEEAPAEVEDEVSAPEPEAPVAIEETEPGARGDTATNVLKPAKITGGYEIQVPLFINEGDRVRIDTRTGEYADRVSKR